MSEHDLSNRNRRRARRCAVLALIALCLAAGRAQDEPGRDRLQFADGLFERGLYEMAVREYQGYLDDQPEGPGVDVAHYRMGECYRLMNKLLEAERSFRTVYTRFPDSPYRLKAGYKRANLFVDTGQYEAAVELFDLVLEQNPPPEIQSAARYFKAEALLQQDQFEAAAPLLRQVADAAQDDTYKAYALLKLGHIEIAHREQPAKALPLLQQALETAATDRVRAEALFQIAELHFRTADYEQSAKHYAALLERYPGDPRSREAALQASWAAHHAGLYAQALEQANAALARGAEEGMPAEQRAEWLYVKANAERQLLRNREAVASYAELIGRYPDSPFTNAALYEKAVTFYKMGMFERAVAEANRVTLDAELRRDVYWLLAESYAALGEDAQAVQFYQLLIRHFPDSKLTADALYRLGHNLQESGEHKEAARYFQSIVETFPDRELAPKALFASAANLLREGQEAEAARDWARLVEQYKESPLVEEALYQKALCEVRLERDEDALASLRDLLRRFPNTAKAPDARYWEGMVLLKADKVSDAEDAFRKALAADPRAELARDARYYLASALQRGGKDKEAAKEFLAIVETPARKNFTPSLLVWLTRHLFAEKQFEAALTAADLLVENGDTPAWKQAGHALRGRCLLQRGAREEAAAAFRAALELEANTRYAAEAALRLGEIALEAGRVEDAIGVLRRAAEAADDEETLDIRAEAYAALGEASTEAGRLQDAARYYMSVAILYDDPALVPACLEGAAEAFGKLGDPAARQKAIDELRERYPESEQAKRLAE